MSKFNPYMVEEVPFANAAVSEFASRTRYFGGVAGLGAGTVYVPGEGGNNGWVEAGDAPTDADIYADSLAEVWGNKASQMARSAGLPAWVGPVVGLGALGVGGYFLFKAIRRRR